MEGEHLGVPGIDWRIILKWIFEKWVWGMWTGLMWFKRGTDCGLL
jgi:hypothetical protein